MDLGVKGKVAIVTGGSDGIGRAAAHRLSAEGALVALVSRTQADLDAAALEISNLTGSEVIGIAADARSEAAVEAMMQAVVSHWGRIDILINNAGYGRWGELTSHDRDDYTKMLQLNITTLTDLCHLYIPDMVTQGGGGIINVGSMASLSPIPYASVYSSSKAYVLMFSEAIRYEYRDQGIKVMALLPGGTESEFARVATEKSEKLSERYKEGSAAGTGMQTSHEVALECLEAFEKNKQYILCGGKNRLLHMLTKLMSRQRVLEMVGGMFKKVAG